MDAFWRNTIAYLDSISAKGSAVAALPEFKQVLPSIVPYGEIDNYNADFFQALVIHKGLYKRITPAFLHEFLSRAKPTFANEVFIVLSRSGKPLKSRDPHLAHLRQIAQWAAHEAGPLSDTPQAPEELPADTVLSQMVDFIARNLAMPVDPGRDGSPIAIAETAERFNDSAWFWVDDTGKTAELFAIPSVRDAYPDLADATLDYVLRLSSDRIIRRRSAVPELKLVQRDPEAFRANNSFFNLTGNLKKGIVRPSIRFNDHRTRFLADYSGNVLRFRFRGRRQAVDVEDSIVRWSIDERPDRIVFSHTSAVRARPLFGNDRHVCDLTYRYTLFQARPAVELEVELTSLPNVVLNNVQLSTAFDQLCLGGTFDRVTIGRRKQYQVYAAQSPKFETLNTGPADYLGISESAGIPGFAHAFHVRFRNGSDLGDIVAEGSRPGQFHWIYPRYVLGRVGPEETRTIVEDRLVTGGGYYGEPDIYARLLEETKTTDENIDPSMSYDIGAELNAVALTLLFSQRARYRVPLGSERISALKSWYDRHLAIYVSTLGLEGGEAASRVFIRGLSFVLLSLDCMARAYGIDEYRRTIERLAAFLMTLEVPVQGGREESIFSGELDCHVSALLALARICIHGDPDGRVAGAIARGLKGIVAGDVGGELFGQAGLVFESLYARPLTDSPPGDAGFWNFKLGLALRAFNAIRQVHEAGFLPLDRSLLSHLDQLTNVARRGIMRSLRHEGDTIEVLTSQYSGETNSETQPWVALGLVPAVEWELFGRPSRAGQPSKFSAEPPLLGNEARPSIVEFDKMAPRLHVEWDCSEALLNSLVDRIRRNWTQLGESRPHWSAISKDEYLPFRIEATEADFYASGKADCDRLLATIARVGRDPSDFSQVLEYGCGLGRITNHLAVNFKNIVACDISEPHLVRARAHSAGLGHTNIDYRLASPTVFGMSDGFDLWFTIIVLQHNPPPVIAFILRRALSMLRPGGLAIFQLPTYASNYRFNIETYLGTPPAGDIFEMHCLPQAALFKIVREAGCQVLEVIEDNVVGDENWLSNVVTLEKMA